uniref:Sec1 family domain-containing protein 1 n=1 Tax=Chromera velia CCMP2878 TaxID=1169474 RepID=A0A0G4GIB1_9ALVE|mmetsp:Transcript_43276/g.85371  ORF Transcript_43276/g.85371 Transcript_43276/m.85371 type:complete len:643 (+) Transcript_43276:225-2153(+)|eukprot:Cvel_22037.t1-p1 / transcript=Cvel_22037.t1 / gene=Cvel_22037 / organism=Chromera_velia_CCMP2878 / gene_product=SEC1 family transport protein SLY1, putative / transcript_product=SEC1 family transport protein SLY1, putative / location=Cvel_scaffold2127:8582-17534(-) / protein_length=642 / sequence_SO=supercontig / SO=protein_coding / is_pseudo=false
MASSMSLNILEAQKNAVIRMLNLSTTSDASVPLSAHTSSRSGGAWSEGSVTWKVLLYDKECQDRLATLMKIGSLRQHAVTLHLSIEKERSPVVEAPAVYFVDPTEDNIQRIVSDLEKGLYHTYYINFSSPVSQGLLDALAKGTVQASSVLKVAKVCDRFLSFVSLSPNLFSLNMGRAYEELHGNEDSRIEACIERIADGLLSVVCTLGQVPVIRYPQDHASQLVAERLSAKLKALLGRKTAHGTQSLFAASSSQRPCLILLDRDFDLSVMIAHTWLYQALVHDLLGLRLNQVTVPTEDPGGGMGGETMAPPKPKKFDLDHSDALWAKHAGSDFPNAAMAAHEALNEYNTKMAQLTANRQGAPDADFSTSDISSALNALPEMTEKKRSIDSHTNILTALVNEIKARQLDKFYEMEEGFAGSGTAAAATRELEALIRDRNKGTIKDKARAVLTLFLLKPSLTSQQVEQLRGALRDVGADSELRALDFLQKLSQRKNMRESSQMTELSANPSAGGALASLAARVGDQVSRGLLAGVKQLLTKRQLLVTKAVGELLEQKAGGHFFESFAYMDPRAAALGLGPEARVRSPFRQGIVFVVGGGNYVEAHALQHTLGGPEGKQIIYGATELTSPCDFVEELERLGGASF